MRLNIGALFLRADDGEPPRAVRIVNNRGANVWIGSVCVCGDASAWRELAKAALEAAAIEEECAALKQEKERS